MIFNNIREKINTMFILKAALKKTEIPVRPFFKMDDMLKKLKIAKIGLVISIISLIISILTVITVMNK